MKKKQEYIFIRQVEFTVSHRKVIGTTYPKKVTILYDKHTAIATEGIITYCIQNSKAVTKEIITSEGKLSINSRRAG